MMRWQMVAMFCACLAGCSTARQYRLAAHELQTQSPHLWCWSSLKDRTVPCDVSDAPALAESACVQTLTASAVGRPSLEVAMGEVEACMKSRGWFLRPLALVPRGKRIPQCTDDRPADQCPATLDQTAR